jgi:hypothetical protein
MQQTAEKEGVAPIELADRNTAVFQRMVEVLGCSNDDFIRTTEERHKIAVRNLWRRMEANGDIYLGKYGGWYSVRQEAYFDESETTVGEDGVRANRSAPRSNGSRRKAIISACRPMATSCSSSTRQPGLRRTGRTPQRGGELRQGRPEGSFDLAHHLRLGRAGPGNDKPMSCMSGSTR